MTFSVLQSVYRKDNPEFLNKSLESLFNQLLKPSLIILVKDGLLTEELENVIKKWEDQLPLKVVGYEQNKGLAYALNFGLQFVETEFVARMDSDDICYPERFLKQIDFLKKNIDVEILGSGISEFYEYKNGNIFENYRFYPTLSDKKSKLLYRGTPIAHPTVLIKTKLLRQYRYSEDTSMNEDVDLWMRLLCDGHLIYNIQEPLLHFRITDGTFKRRSIKKALNEYKIYNYYLRKLFGFSLFFIFPFLRLITRFLPSKIIKFLYFSNIRKKILKS